MAKMIEMKCPGCGGQMKLHNEKARILKCPYCECQVMLGKQVTHNYSINNNYINAKNVTVTGKADSASLWEKYSKLIKLQDRASAVKVLDQIIEDNPYDINALKEKIRIADYAFDKGEVLSKFAAGESLEKVAVYHVRKLFDKEFRYLHSLVSDNDTMDVIKNSLTWAKIEAIHKHCQEKQAESIEWKDLPTGYFFQLIDSQKRYSIEEWSNSECRKFNDYIKKAYQDDYHLDEITSFMLLKDKKTVIFKARSYDGDYTSFLVFRVNGRSLNAPSYFVHGDFEFKPSLFNKKYEFHRIGDPKSRKHPCNISLSQFHDGDVYALTFDDNKTVYFVKTESTFEETRNAVKWGWGHNGIPFTFDPW